MKLSKLFFSIVVIFLFSLHLSAQIPRLINYQGLLQGSDEQPVAEGDYKVTFSIYDEANNFLWSEAHQKVFVVGGFFHVLLGTVTPLNLPFDETYLVGVKVNNDPEMQPRMLLTSSAYSLNSERLGGFEVSSTPLPNKLLPLDSVGKIPSGALPNGSAEGNYLKKNIPDTSRGNYSVPLLNISNLGVSDGIIGQGVDGIGVAGRSEKNNGVAGWTGTSGKSGIFGLSTNGRGVTGRSDLNDGVVGYTAADQKSGVYGHTDAADGFGVFGRNAITNCYGYVGGDAGVFGRSEGIYHAGHFETSGGLNAAVYGKTTGSNSFGGWFVAAGNYTYGIYAEGPPAGNIGCAARFKGNVEIRSHTTDEIVIELGEGLDYAEGFYVSNHKEISRGAILIIDSDNPGKLALSNEPYDKKVAGIVAGAKGLGSGVKLGPDKFDFDVALAGRVYCNVDANYGEVEPGDLLTTSPTPGYAMVVKDYKKAKGAILGKAMEKLSRGTKDQILVLVTLQ